MTSCNEFNVCASRSSSEASAPSRGLGDEALAPMRGLDDGLGANAGPLTMIEASEPKASVVWAWGVLGPGPVVAAVVVRQCNT